MNTIPETTEPYNRPDTNSDFIEATRRFLEEHSEGLLQGYRDIGIGTDEIDKWTALGGTLIELAIDEARLCDDPPWILRLPLSDGSHIVFPDLTDEEKLRREAEEEERERIKWANDEARERSPQMMKHVDFVLNLPAFSEFRRELLSNELHVKLRENGSWVKALNQLDYIKGNAREHRNDKGNCIYQLGAFTDYLAAYTLDHMKPRLLLDVPEWDGIDRIKQITEVCELHNFTEEEFYKLLVYYGVQVFKRLDDHTLQPYAIVIKGWQGCGKDTLIKALVGGFGFYAKQLETSGFDLKEARAQLHTALVFIIEELDRIEPRKMAELKNLLTTPTTDMRLSYDRRDERRLSRACFIASTNANQPTPDVTGNRRYAILDAKYLGFNAQSGALERTYPGHYASKNCEAERLQILAQYQAFHEQGFELDKALIEKVRQVARQHTPSASGDKVVERVDELVMTYRLEPSTFAVNSELSVTGFSKIQLEKVLEVVSQEMNKPVQTILSVLGKQKRREKLRNAMVYRVGPCRPED